MGKHKYITWNTWEEPKGNNAGTDLLSQKKIPLVQTCFGGL